MELLESPFKEHLQNLNEELEEIIAKKRTS